jgi:hypothetical protein
MIFVGIDNIYEMTVTDADSNRILPIGTVIKDKIKNYNTNTAVCKYVSALDSVVIGFSRGCLVWNIRTRAWTEWDIPINRLIVMNTVSDGNKCMFTKYNNGYMYELNSFESDDGVDIKFELETKTFDINEFAEFKKYRSVKFVFDTNYASPFYSAFKVDDNQYCITELVTLKDQNDLWDKGVWDAAKWAGGTLRIATHILNDKTIGNYFSVNISGENCYDLTIHKIAVEAVIKERRREQ